MGDLKSAMDNAGLTSSRSIDIEFKNVSYEVKIGIRKRTKKILKGVSGYFKSGQLTAIMGPSGAGKTSLFHILTGFCRLNVTGSIKYIGPNSSVGFKEYKKALRYIQQEDKLYPSFTVIEVMQIAAELKLGLDISTIEKQSIIEDTMKRFDLARVQDVRSDLLSGGQRKRLCIAVELLDNPRVVFLDEPTTGLDSSLSTECITTLKTLASEQRTIVCVIHQPSAALYGAFDQVYFLAEGRCVYQGLPGDTVPYFKELGLCCPLYHNPADYVIEVISNEYGFFIEDLERTASEISEYSKPGTEIIEKDDEKNCQDDYDNDDTGTTKMLMFDLAKFMVLTRRYVIQMSRERGSVQVKIGLHILLGILLGIMFLNCGNSASKALINIRFILCSSVFLCYTTLMPAVLRYPLELPVLHKENFNNWYHLRLYFAATNAVNIPFQIILTILYCSIAYVLSGQILEWNRFFMFLMVGVLTGLTAESIGLLYGTLWNPINGTFMGAATLGVAISLAGFIPLFRHMPSFMYNLTYLSFIRYSMESMIISVYGFGREKLVCPSDVTICQLRYPKSLLYELYIDESVFWPNIAALFCNFLIIRLLAYWALKRRLRST